MDTLPLVTPKQLVALGFELIVPCRVEGLPGLDDLVCLKTLRLIPDKRMVFLATNGDDKIVVKLVNGQRRQMQQCAAEEKGIIALEGLAVSTQKIYASYWGESTDVGYIATRYIENGQDLHTIWLRQTDEQRVTLLAQIMRIFCKMHNGGVFQEDAHLNNFLWQRDEIIAIDGASINTEHQGKPLDHEQSLKNLAVLFSQLYPHFDPLIPAALAYYLQHRTGLSEPITLPALEKELATTRKERLASYLKKVFRESTEHVCFHNQRQFVVLARAHDTPMARAFVDNPDVFVEQGKMLKNGNSSTVVLTVFNDKPCVIKRYNMKSMPHAIRRSVQPSRAWVSWQNAHMLKAVGIPTPEPVLLYETRWGAIRSTAYFICEQVTDARPLSELIEQGLNQDEGLTLFEPFFNALQLSLITHGDMKATNFFVRDGVVISIDIDGMRWHRSVSAFEQAFARDKERFLQNWSS